MTRSDWQATLQVGSHVWHPWCLDGIGIVQEVQPTRGGILLMVAMPEEANRHARGKVLGFGPEHLYDPVIGVTYMERVRTLPKPTVSDAEIVIDERSDEKGAEGKRKKVKRIREKKVFRRRCKIIAQQLALLNNICQDIWR